MSDYLVWHKLKGRMEKDDKGKMKILKSHRRTIYVLIIIGLIININDIITKQASFWSGLIFGGVGVLCIWGLVTNIKLTKRIGMRIK
jgi:hypothetical protein